MKINNFGFSTQLHDDQENNKSAEGSAEATTFNCSVMNIALGLEPTILNTPNITCLQNCVLEGFGHAVYYVSGAATLRLYIDGTLVGSQAMTVNAPNVLCGHSVMGNKAVLAGARVVTLKVLNQAAGAIDLLISAGVFGGCVKT